MFHRLRHTIRSHAAAPIVPKRCLLTGALSPNALMAGHDESGLAAHEEDLMKRIESSFSTSTASSAQPFSYPFPVFSYVARVQYDGTNYGGLQSQGGTNRKSTIQEVFEAALRKVFKEEDPRGFSFMPSGRTDAGVHALDQHLQFYTSAPWLSQPVLLRTSDAAKRLVLALNSHLPHTVRCFEVYQTAPDFSVRFDALAKTYSYYVTTSHVQSPFAHGRRLQFTKPLDVDRVREAWAAFEGEHCFWSFSSSSPDGATRDPVRVMTRCAVDRIEGGLCLQVTGSGFLYRQVRHMVGATLAVGAGRLDLAKIKELLRQSPSEDLQRSPNALWQVAGTEGLYLRSVLYPPGHDDPTRLFHPTLQHQENGKIDGTQMLLDPDFGDQIKAARRRFAPQQSPHGLEIVRT